MLKIRIVFAEVFICPETMELLQKSLRETHFGATATCFKFPWRIGRKSEMKQVGISGCRIVFFEFAATRFDLADRFYPAPGRGRFILKGARLRRASGLAGQGSPHQARDPEFQLFIFWNFRVAGRVHLQPVPTRFFCRRV